jgi:B12 binding domain/Radical SAM superfamily
MATSPRLRGPHERMVAAAHRLHPKLPEVDASKLANIPAAEPNRLRQTMIDVLRGYAARVVVTGTLERRLLALEHPVRSLWTMADLSGAAHAERDWPAWARAGIRLTDPDNWISSAEVSEAAVRRLTHPRVLLVALYHREHFPLPRFPLGISDLARAARATLTGEVELLDMQLGVTLDDILATVDQRRPDIIGVSATFGQHDLMTRLLDVVTASAEPLLVLAGGSLTARNERLLLERYPTLLVARGAGEPTIQDVLSYWHNDLDLDQIRGIGYATGPRGQTILGVGPLRRNATVANRAQDDIFPELDLLDQTFARRGVAQLESSRGCTNYCSFCPRGHKGTWAGTAPEQLPSILAAMSEIFNRHPGISRTLYLVDEEFIGRGPDAAPRARAIAAALHDARFRWETSCRVDQIVRNDADRDWHLDRAQLWRVLVEHGLRRCLFGVESGVTSILKRFNKETTGEQNALAIRTLSALGVPTRFTYITFDQLMTAAELRTSHAFQTRTDLLLRPLPELTVEQIVDGVGDDDFAAAHAIGQPFYTRISYLLVSMECLIGAAYTRAVQAAGLAGEPRPALGRVDARFLDWRIGRCSEYAQLWIDRSFALDYTLKSLEKILDGPPYNRIRKARVVIKDAAIAVLTSMLDLIEITDLDTETQSVLNDALATLLDHQLSQLRDQMAAAIAEVAPTLPEPAARMLTSEYARWEQTGGWTLINAAEPCGAGPA